MIGRRTFLRTVGLASAAATLTACTVRPLYAPAAGSGAKPLAGRIEIDPPASRLGLEVREALLFRIGGGDAVATNPQYRVSLSVSGRATGVFTVRNADGIDRTTAGQYVATGAMTIRDIDDNTVIGTYTRSATALYDKSRQEFASERALRDAENRAARELGEQLYAVLIASVHDRAG